MKLPLALKNQLEESGRKFQQLLGRLGVSREELDELAVKIERKRTVRPAPPAGEKPISGKGRVYHV